MCMDNQLQTNSRWSKVVLSLFAIAMIFQSSCVSPAPEQDAGTMLEPEADAGDNPVPFSDGGVAQLDAGSDQTGPADGFGEISGSCGVLSENLLADLTPSIIGNTIDFGNNPYDEADFDSLTSGGQEVINDGNAGGSSLYSEVFAFEVLSRCEDAELLKTETEIAYTDPQGKLTDLLVQVREIKLGVSVTRAVGFPREDPYTKDDARALLDQKLQGVLESTANVAPEDAWSRQILYVIAYAQQHADSLNEAWEEVDVSLQSSTILWVTVSDGDDEFLY